MSDAWLLLPACSKRCTLSDLTPLASKKPQSAVDVHVDVTSKKVPQYSELS